jgi:glutathione S-transferase
MSKITLVLIGSLTSPFVRKVRLAAATLRLPLTFKLESAWSAGTKLGALNPLVKVPVLMTPDAGPLYDSRVIIAYLERLSGVDLRPPEDIAGLIDQRIEALADGVSEAIALSVQESWRGPDMRSVVWIDRQSAKIEYGLAALAHDVATGALSAEQVTSGALATVCALDFLSVAQPMHAWRKTHPGLAIWADIWRDLPHYDETSPHHSVEKTAYPNL